jgi:GT2 family glycosyltransferase
VTRPIFTDAGAARPVVSVIVPYLDTPGALDRCVASLALGCNGVGYELIVVDNGSRPEMAPRVERGRELRVVRNDANRGFAAACNQGAAVAAGRYLLFLNSDATVASRSISRLVAAMECDEGLAAVAPLLRDPRGSTKSPGRAWLGPGSQALALLGYARARSSRAVAESAIDVSPWLSAAALLVRARVFRLLGGFDEGYFFYEEDEDLAWRFARRGYRVAVCGDALVEHHGGLSSDTVGPWPSLALYVGQVRFVRRRCGIGGEWLYRASTATAVSAKAVKGRLVGRPAPTLARVAPSRVLRLLCSRRMQVRIAEE